MTLAWLGALIGSSLRSAGGGSWWPGALAGHRELPGPPPPAVLRVSANGLSKES